MSEPHTYSDFTQHLSYWPETGDIVWHTPTCPRIKAGAIAGCLDNKGYWRLTFKGRSYSAHRLAWLLHFKKWPENQIDHINRNPIDNRISNLRDVPLRVNLANRRKDRARFRCKGTKGVTRTKSGSWQAQVWSHQEQRIRYLGVFPTEVEASRVARAAMEMKL